MDTNAERRAWLDEPGPLREPEAVPHDRLTVFLGDTLPDVELEDLEVEQYLRGFSNLTYRVRVGGREFVLRRPPPGVKIRSAHDMGREFRILTGLTAVGFRVPRPVAYCADPGVLGAPFYLMERVPGVILRTRMPPEMVPAPKLMATIAEGLIDTLAELHAVDYRAAGLGDLGRPVGYADRQISGWARRWETARTDEIPDARIVAGWLADHIPAPTSAALIHNDFKYDNVVLAPEDWSHVRAILDWEMATLGDPLMDLGTSLAYWIQPDDPPELTAARLSPTSLPGNPSRHDVVERYARASGRDTSGIVFHYAYGLFKVAVIVQQLYARYRRGLTDDPRYADLIDGVRALCLVARRAIELNRIDDLF